jgi:hypothetical protein
MKSLLSPIYPCSPVSFNSLNLPGWFWTHCQPLDDLESLCGPGQATLATLCGQGVLGSTRLLGWPWTDCEFLEVLELTCSPGEDLKSLCCLDWPWNLCAGHKSLELTVEYILPVNSLSCTRWRELTVWYRPALKALCGYWAWAQPTSLQPSMQQICLNLGQPVWDRYQN